MDEAVEVIKEAERAGWTVTTTAKSHRRLVSPDGGKIVIGSATPGDVRSIKNLTGELRRGGLEVRRGTAKRRHPSSSSNDTIEKLVVQRDPISPRVLQASIYALLGDGPLSEGMLVHVLRSEGVKIVASDLAAPLSALIGRGAVKQVRAEYVRVHRRPPRRVRKPPISTGTAGPVWCSTRKGLWHATPHNNRPSADYRSLCGYLMTATADYEQRRPDCPYCLEKLELVTFL